MTSKCLIWIVAGILILCLCIGVVSANGFLSPKIAFESFRDGNYEIYVMNADGSGQTRLTNNGATDVWPSWSPDGSQILFSSGQTVTGLDLYVMNADGTNMRKIHEYPGLDFEASWQP